MWEKVKVTSVALTISKVKKPLALVCVPLLLDLIFTPSIGWLNSSKITPLTVAFWEKLVIVNITADM